MCSADKIAQNLIKKQKLMDIEKLKLEAQNKALHIADVRCLVLFKVFFERGALDF